jgi:hypothetical protein
MILEVEKYNKLEQKALEDLPNRVVEMCRTVMFNSEGYPVRVSNEKELWKYLDVMHETRFLHNINEFFDGYLTETEYSDLKKLSTVAAEFSKINYAKSLAPTGSLLRSLQLFRFLQNIFLKSGDKVLEIGPGSGQLGGLFLVNNYSYSSTDITQAFYLHQNRYFNYITKQNLHEVLSFDSVHDLYESKNCHIPWWIYAELWKHKIPQFDLITCNHALAEMHMNSLKYTLKLSSLMLEKSNGFFVFESWGYDKFIKSPVIHRLFEQNGFILLWNSRELTVYKKISGPLDVPTNNNEIANSLVAKESENSTSIDQSLGKMPKWAKHGNSIFKRLFPRQQREIQNLSTLANIKINLHEKLTVDDFMPTTTYYGKKINDLKNRRKECIGKVTKDTVCRHYSSLFSSDNINSDDEKLLEFIGSKYI